MERLVEIWTGALGEIARSTVLVVLAAWLGQVWATRIANRERAASDARLQAQRHQQDRLIEELRDSLAAERQRVDTAMLAATSTFADARPRVIDAISKLWHRVVAIRDGTARYYFYLDLLSPDEIAKSDAATVRGSPVGC